MSKRIIIVSSIIFLSIISFSQNDTLEMLQGEWVLSEYKHEPYSKLYSNNDTPITDVLADTAVILKISDKKIEVISVRFTKYDTINYNYKIIPDDYYQFKIELKPEKIKRSKRKHQYSFPLTSLNIVKISNSLLSIRTYNLNYNTPFLNSSTSNLYFKKTLDSTKTSELDIKGKWYTCDTISNYNNRDTLILLKEPCSSYNETYKYRTGFEFDINFEKDNSFNFSIRSYGTAFVTKSNWRIIPNKNILEIYTNKESIKFNYKFIDDKLILIKEKN